ncbi:hypothetical protein COOONC_14124, partial [Cooperia oncophora]
LLTEFTSSSFLLSSCCLQVKVAHFGGGDLNTSTKAEEKLSRKDVIADLIAKTRQAREEKHIAKDEMETVTEDLDAKYLKLLDKVKNVFRPVGATKAEKSEKDDYDKLIEPVSKKKIAIDSDEELTDEEQEDENEEELDDLLDEHDGVGTDII